MRLRILLIAVMLLVCAPVLAGDGECTVYGSGVSAPDTVLISRILDAPEQWVGETIRVEGTAVATCPHRGCWLNISSDREGEVIRMKVKDGEIVFPMEIIGDHVVVEGVFKSNKLDLETSRKVCSYEAQKKGEDFDPESMTECMTLYEIAGTGAVATAAAAE